MTAYIKMIDVWMIFTMLNPFCVVTLYAVKQTLLEGDHNSPVTMVQLEGWSVKQRSTRVVTFLLNKGLPLLSIIFTIIFWLLGINNTVKAELYDSC